MNNDKQNTKIGEPINCNCGRVLARIKDGRIFIKCRWCKELHEIELNTEPKKRNAYEPKSTK